MHAQTKNNVIRLCGILDMNFCDLLSCNIQVRVKDAEHENHQLKVEVERERQLLKVLPVYCSVLIRVTAHREYCTRKWVHLANTVFYEDCENTEIECTHRRFSSLARLAHK